MIRENTTTWTRDLVKDRIREAQNVLRAMPMSCFPSETMTAWPGVIHDWQVAYGYTEERVSLPRPSPAEVDRMYEAVGWFMFIAEQKGKNGCPPDTWRRIVRNQSRAVWLCYGCGMGPRRASGIMGGCSRHSVMGWRDDGLRAILGRLNAIKLQSTNSPSTNVKSPQVGQPRPRARRAFSGAQP